MKYEYFSIYSKTSEPRAKEQSRKVLHNHQQAWLYFTTASSQSGNGEDFCAGKFTHTVVAPPSA